MRSATFSVSTTQLGATAGCSIKDKKGEPLKETVDPKAAKVATRASETDLDGKIVLQPEGSAYQYAVTIEETSPSMTISLTMTVIVYGKEVELLCVVPTSFLSSTTRNLTFHVDGTFGDDTSLCDETKPCKSIQRALGLIPAEIAHHLVVKVRGGQSYAEDVVLASRSITKGSIILEGVLVEGARPKIVGKKTAVLVKDMQASREHRQIRNFVLEMPTPAIGNAALVIVASMPEMPPHLP